MNKPNLDHLRHSCAHLLAAAVVELWPETKRTIGPAIENGFYYDFDFGPIKISEDDLPKIEAKMHEVLSTWDKFEGREVTVAQAKATYSDNPYKLELIEEFSQKGQKLTFYRSGSYEDLCLGGHTDNPKEVLKHFKLLSLAGAYWRGSEKNKMLTRIYGTCFSTQEELSEYLSQLEEAKKRDHKKLGPALDLFMFHETAPGMPYWLPKGLTIINELVDFWRAEHAKRGYQEIKSPLINKKELYETSGHWDHYLENMFVSEPEEGQVYALKPMNCPNAMVVFESKTRSYRELPLRLSDTDTLHRYERSGTLMGLLRVREFSQDDAHIFVSPDQIEEEYKQVMEITDLFYSIFGIDYSYRLGTRPENFMGEAKTWDKAEAELNEILNGCGKPFSILKGDGAFYGPKIDILMKDSIGRQWQMGTIQLDFQIPQRFNLKYSDSQGNLQTPVVIHRVVYGSLERFVGILIEHFSGAFPIWIAPVQAIILPISDKHLEYALEVLSQLSESNLRVEIDSRNQPLNSRIRDAQLQKIPYMLIIGNKEQASKNVSIRHRSGQEEIKTISEFSKHIKDEVDTKAIH